MNILLPVLAIASTAFSAPVSKPEINLEYKALMDCYSETYRYNNHPAGKNAADEKLSQWRKSFNRTAEGRVPFQFTRRRGKNILFVEGQRPFGNQYKVGVYGFNDYGACFYKLDESFNGEQKEEHASVQKVVLNGHMVAAFAYTVNKSNSPESDASELPELASMPAKSCDDVSNETSPNPKTILIKMIAANIRGLVNSVAEDEINGVYTTVKGMGRRAQQERAADACMKTFSHFFAAPNSGDMIAVRHENWKLDNFEFYQICGDLRIKLQRIADDFVATHLKK